MPTAVPASDTIAGTWAPSAGSSLFGTIDEGAASDADYDQSAVSPFQADVFEVKLGSLADPNSSTGHQVGYRYKKNATGGEQINLKVSLIQGTNVIAEWTHLNISAVTTATQTLSGAQADSITNYGDLRLRFKAWRQPDPPIAPATANYSIPAGAVSVSSQSALETAIAGATQDIVIENGSYSRTGPLTIGNKRLWARTFGGVTLNYGIIMGGGEVHGLTCAVTSTAQAATNAIILASSGSNNVVTDVAVSGASGLADGIDGIRASSPGGFVCKRATITNVTGNGLWASDGNASSTALINEISDITVNGAKYSNPGFSDGNSEAGVRIGHNVVNSVNRISTRNTGWYGIRVGGAARSFQVNHFDIDDVAVAGTDGGYGVYVYNNSRFITFNYFHVGSNVSQGFRLAGDYGQAYGLAAQTTLPSSTINVNEATTAAASSGTLYVGNPDGTISTVTYTGKTSTSFTGCSGGSGTYPAGTIVAVGGTSNATPVAGGPAAYGIAIQNGTISAAIGNGTAVYYESGVMVPTLTNVSITRYVSGTAIVDKTNNPAADQNGTSNLVQTNVRIVPAEVGSGDTTAPVLQAASFSGNTVTFTYDEPITSSGGTVSLGSEIIGNPGFESPLGTTYSAYNATLSQVTSPVHSGTQAARLVTNGATAAEGLYSAKSAVASITPGATYRMSAWVNAPNGAAMKIGVEWYNSSSALISSAESVFTGNGAYQQVQHDFVAPAGASMADIFVYTGNVIQVITFSVDDVSLKLVTQTNSAIVSEYVVRTTGAGSGTELIANPTFDTNATNWTAN